MKTFETDFKGVFLVENPIFEDNRGFFTELYNKNKYRKEGLSFNFVQDNLSFSKYKGNIRALHFQSRPFDQTKFVTVLNGSIYDVVVDLRVDSPTFKKWRSFELSAEKKTQLVIPRGFAHGFCTITDNTMVHYKVDNDYSSDHNKGIRWNDPVLNITWPTKDPILSDQDQRLPFFEEASCDFF